MPYYGVVSSEKLFGSDVLILAHWPNDAITVRSLTVNAQGC